MDLTRLLLRMSLWVRRRPAAWQVWTVAGVIVFGLALYWIENSVGWPDALKVNAPVRGPQFD